MVLGLPRPSLCAWCSLDRLPTEATRKLFLYHFLKETTLFFRFVASPTCSMPRQDFFVPYLLPSHVKYYPNSQNFRHFKTAEGKKLCNDDVNRASVL